MIQSRQQRMTSSKFIVSHASRENYYAHFLVYCEVFRSFLFCWMQSLENAMILVGKFLPTFLLVEVNMWQYLKVFANYLCGWNQICSRDEVKSFNSIKSNGKYFPLTWQSALVFATTTGKVINVDLITVQMNYQRSHTCTIFLRKSFSSHLSVRAMEWKWAGIVSSTIHFNEFHYAACALVGAKLHETFNISS